ncbi:hypothetical protein Hanom_Chr06g00519361 [Helianthus anomalus]
MSHTRGCGLLRWAITTPVKVIPVLLSRMEKKDEMAITKAKESCCTHNKVNDLGTLTVQNDEFDEVSYVLKEWFYDYESMLEVLKAESGKDMAANEEYYEYSELDYHPEVLEKAWDYSTEPKENWYHNPYKGEHSSSLEWSNDDYHWK